MTINKSSSRYDSIREFDFDFSAKLNGFFNNLF
mgnify:CR=1 FL=1